jgi:hypothetical protein
MKRGFDRINGINRMCPDSQEVGAKSHPVHPVDPVNKLLLFGLGTVATRTDTAGRME